MDDEAVLDAALAVAVPAYAALLDARPAPPPAGRLLVYWDGDAPYQLVPPLHVTTSAAPWRFDDAEELHLPAAVDEAPAVVALHRAIVDEERDLLAAWFDRLAAALPVPVVVESYDGIVGGAPWAEQLRGQLPPDVFAALDAQDVLPRDRSADEALATLDVVLRHRISREHVAAVHRDRGVLWLSRRLDAVSSSGHGLPLDGPRHDAGGAPQVVGGLLPPGAARVEVTDLRDAVHEAQVGGGAWLCVLPHDALGGPPPVRFLAEDGTEVLRLGADAPPAAEEDVPLAWVTLPAVDAPEAYELDDEDRAVLAAAPVPPAWPAQLPGPPALGGWTGEPPDLGGIDLHAGGAELSIGTDVLWDTPPVAAREALRARLDDGRAAREVARLLLDAAPLRLPGRLPGRAAEVQFTGLAAGGAWAVVLASPVEVLVSATGPVPERLDLEPFAPG